MAAAFEVYRQVVAAAQQQLLVDKLAAQQRYAAAVQAAFQPFEPESVYHPTGGYNPGWPVGGDTNDQFSQYQAALNSASTQLASDLLAAEGRRQGTVGVARDLALTQVVSGADPF